MKKKRCPYCKAHGWMVQITDSTTGAFQVVQCKRKACGKRSSLVNLSRKKRWKENWAEVQLEEDRERDSFLNPPRDDRRF